MVDISIVQGDITKLSVDAIVNAAKPSLMGGGGVDGAIHAAAGPKLLESCLCHRGTFRDGLPTGAAVITPGFDLPAKYVIHTVGPTSWDYEGERHELGAELLANCYTSSLSIANFLGLHTIAFPSISTGVYGWDLDEAVSTAVAAVESFFALEGFYSTTPSVEKVQFVAFDHDTFEKYVKTLA